MKNMPEGESRHVGHTVIRGYNGKKTSAVLWQDGGTYYILSGPGTASDVLDKTQEGAFGVAAGGGHH